jgi:hypothetical protein
MNFFKKLFGSKSEEKKENNTGNQNSGQPVPNENNNIRKEMTTEDVIYECVKVAEENLIAKGYVITDMREDTMKMPQLTIEKEGVKVFVFVGACRNDEEINVVFQNEQLSSFMTFARENEADCLIALVNVQNSQNTKTLYYGDSNKYTIKYQLYPSLL